MLPFTSWFSDNRCCRLPAGRRVRLCPVRTPCGGFEPVSVEPLLYR
ncbi:hypothetical protein Taro_034527 [Colocasia esculenta]|uniref:Uncharacterized protein n=1 Tax=Colocasia esculenta TaxID=4460 RepID=A0A843VY04_COLES|nr:hypothetical protein [Colocasia esculenta]